MIKDKLLNDLMDIADRYREINHPKHNKEFISELSIKNNQLVTKKCTDFL